MSLMPVSCRLARLYCRLYHNTKAINFSMRILDISHNSLS